MTMSMTRKKGSQLQMFRHLARKMRIIFLFILSALLLCLSQPCLARDVLSAGQNITGNTNTLVSAGRKFALGLFPVPGSTDGTARYVGIWYYQSEDSEPQTVVWVANRDKPVVNSIGVFRIAEDGNLVVIDTSGKNYWSSGLKGSSSTNRTVKLLDTGNLVLRDHLGISYLWQSFQHPTDTFLPGMKMDTSLELTSWRDPTDPGSGDFTFKMAQPSDNRYIILNNQHQLYWESGRNGQFNSDALSDTIVYFLSNFTVSTNPAANNSRYNISRRSNARPSDYGDARLLMNSTGELQFLRRGTLPGDWFLRWRAPESPCEIYNACGKFSSCNANYRSSCKCLPGFIPDPRSQGSGYSADFHQGLGCVRRSASCGEDTTFLTLAMVKMGDPDKRLTAENEAACQSKCRDNCLQCQAYSYIAPRDRSFSNCWIWTQDLTTLQEEYLENYGRNLSVRVDISDIAPTAKTCEPCGTNIVPYPLSTGQDCGDPMYFKFSCNQSTEVISLPNPLPKEPTPTSEGNSKSPLSLILGITLASVVILAFAIIFAYVWRRKIANKGSIKRKQGRFYDSERHVKGLIDVGGLEEKDNEGIEVPYFDFESILLATDNFSDANKLGRGGYGPVYKGKLQGGQVVAVKRLSSVSSQGLQEFKNEVVLIAKLQHRNLVRLRGYCIKGDEKILLYEYMPNKSLDSFIFDPTQSVLLDWQMRFDIILGVARGLLYLHQDSRLRVIHRDLKTSNILLDEEMQPKISDFGLARIVGGKDTEANTERVVGTYGYMSPEYALDGLFSTKSDIFSFGIVLLEIISGKKNTGFYESKQVSSLLGYAWRLWTENKLLELMDLSLHETSNANQFTRCAHIGLLCVQDEPGDRPTMSNVVTMLDSETAAFPTPKQPTFFVSRGLSSTASSSKPEISLQFESSNQEGR